MKHWPAVSVRITAIALALCGIGAALSLAQPAWAGDDEPAVPVAVRIYASADSSWSASGMLGYSELIARLADSDVVFLGEQHDDPATHQMEAAVLQAITEAQGAVEDGERPVVLSLEMFERDVQGTLERYLQGMITEADFLAGSRPWPNYDPDYRRLVEYARAQGLPVVAANIPRPLASRVAKEGFATAWAGYTDEERQWIAASSSAPEDLYWTLFSQLMGGGGHGEGGMDPETIKNFYAAQCIKDDTMAESIVRAREGRFTGMEAPDPATTPQAHVTGPQVVHVNGSFHSDYRLGTVARVLERRPGDRVVTVAFLPVDSFNALPRWPQALCRIGDAVEPAESDAQCPSAMVCLADYIVYVPSPAFGNDEAILVARPVPPEAEGEGQAEGEGAMPAMPATPPPGMPMPPK